MCLYPIIKFSCCDMQYKPTDEPPIVKFCARGRPDTIREPFPSCEVRQPHECNDFFRLPIKCPEHKLQWLNAMDLNDECQAMDARLRDAGVGALLRLRYRDKMARAFEMVAKCADRMEAERLQAWKVKIFCTGAALELLGTAIVGSDAKPLDYAVLERLRERLLRHINAEAEQLREEAERGGAASPRAGCRAAQGEGEEEEQMTTTQPWAAAGPSPPAQSSPPAAAEHRSCTALVGDPDEAIHNSPLVSAGALHPLLARDLLSRQPPPAPFLSFPQQPHFPSTLFEPEPVPLFSVPPLPSQYSPAFLPSAGISPLFSFRGHGGQPPPQFMAAQPGFMPSSLSGQPDGRASEDVTFGACADGGG
ncbi:feb01789-79ff-4868-8e14-676ee08708d5 [Thermothielavioides terrestris]|uniref:Feb01789-79ff-4868-8e14-676ee08708d5 n=1 Tax=Thermothielavioides terrestris TaxID=2587410 RepID=A0A446BMZ5_9PEZI|nr:feb01789-79ff-4868-8e14-676ee08708d5 [Thermothielavioides terrestris]